MKGSRLLPFGRLSNILSIAVCYCVTTQTWQVLTRIEADSGAYKLVVKKARNYVGFIAEGPPDKTGAVDIAIVFRGTVTGVCARGGVIGVPEEPALLHA